MNLAMIAAIGVRGQLGLHGDIPWHEPQDMFLFRQLTMGHVIIMGSKTARSLKKPLRGRTHFVLSRSPTAVAEFGWATVFPSFQEALHAAHAVDDLPFVIGGVSLYQEALPFATHFYLGEVAYLGPADIFLSPSLFLPPWSIEWTACYLGKQGPASMTLLRK